MAICFSSSLAPAHMPPVDLQAKRMNVACCVALTSVYFVAFFAAAHSAVAAVSSLALRMWEGAKG